MDERQIKESVILLVDDEEANVTLLERILRKAGYTNVRGTTDPHNALPFFLNLEPDLVLLDLHMPQLDGFAVLSQLRPHIPEGSYLPILVLTGDLSVEARRRALAVGAKDFLTKPFDRFEVLLRMWNLLETRQLYLAVADEKQSLERRVAERTQRLEEAQQEILERLALAAEYLDDVTGAHTRRVAALTRRLARELGLEERAAELLGRAALVHDLGKVAVPAAIQQKEGKLTPDEWEEMRLHARIGASMLSGSRFELLRLAEEVARTHHERWDGQGYPDGLAGEQIPLAGRVVAVADAFDALLHQRPYKDAWPLENVLEEIRLGRATRYDPDVVDALLQLAERGEAEPTIS